MKTNILPKKVDVDWDEEYKNALARVLKTKDLYDYYREPKRFVALLADGHTDVSFPNEISQDAEYFSMIPVYLAKTGEEIIAVAVSEEVKDDMHMGKSPAGCSCSGLSVPAGQL